MTKSDINKKALLEALGKSMGNVASACRATGLSRQTFYRYRDEDPEFRLALEDIKEDSKDFAESSLFQQIKDKNTTATIFYLKTKCKDRGYVERQEIENTGNPQIIIQPLSPEALESFEDY